MPYTRIETKHTYNNQEQNLAIRLAPLHSYQIEHENSPFNDLLFMHPFKFDVLYPIQGDEMDERAGRKINVKSIKVMFKTEIPKDYKVADVTYPNSIYYLTKGIHSTLKHSTTASSSGTASAQNVSGETSGHITGLSSAGFYVSDTMDLTNSQQTVQLSTPIDTFTSFDLPAYKLKLKFRVMIVKADKDYFDQAGQFSPHKAISFFCKNRVYLGNDPEEVNGDFKLYAYDNTDQILRESSKYTGQYSVIFDKIISHTCGGSEMVTFDIPVNQELTFDDDTNIPTNKKAYHILIFPPFTNKGMSGPYGYETLPDLIFDNGNQSKEIDAITSVKHFISPVDDGTSPNAIVKILSNVKLFYLDF